MIELVAAWLVLFIFHRMVIAGEGKKRQEARASGRHKASDEIRKAEAGEAEEVGETNACEESGRHGS